MSRRTSVLAMVILVFFALAVGAAACGEEETATETTVPAATTTPTEATTAPAGGTLDGAALVQERCTKCHDLQRVQAKSESAGQWRAIVDAMVAKGAQLSDQERQAVLDYLAATYGE